MTLTEDILWKAWQEIMRERWEMRQVYPKNHQALRELADKADAIMDEIRGIQNEGTERQLQKTSS